MLRVDKKLVDARFDEPVIGLCVSKQKINLGYVLKFGDYKLFISEYIAQIVNLWGNYAVGANIIAKRELSNRGCIASGKTERLILSNIEGNTLLLSSLSLYLNNAVSEFIVADYSEWGTLDKKTKLFICYLLGFSDSKQQLFKLYNISNVTEKLELFSFMLSLIGILNLNMSIIEKTDDIAENSPHIEKIADSRIDLTIDEVSKNSNIFDSVISPNSEVTIKTDRVTVVERSFGKFHKSADTEFYEALVEVVGSTPLYRGKTAWSSVLKILRDDPKYCAITSKYLTDSGYKLNTNNLRNWYTYYTSRTLKTDKFKIISDDTEITDIITELNYNVKKMEESKE